jgi:PBP1b-binding outer membrane lipoprotein LpoB
MTFHYYGALKAFAWILGAAAIPAAIFFSLEPTVKVALIMAAAMVFTALVGSGTTIIVGRMNLKASASLHQTINKVEEQTNNMNTELRQQRNEASKRADNKEGFIEGVASEQERTRDKS